MRRGIVWEALFGVRRSKGFIWKMAIEEVVDLERFYRDSEELCAHPDPTGWVNN